MTLRRSKRIALRPPKSYIYFVSILCIVSTAFSESSRCNSSSQLRTMVHLQECGQQGIAIYSTRDNFYCFQNLSCNNGTFLRTLGNNYTYGFPCECPKCASHCSSYTENQISRTAMFLAQVKTLLVDKAPLLCSSLGDTSKCSKLTTSKSFYQVQLFDLSLHLLSDIHLKVSDTDLSDESSCKGNDTIALSLFYLVNCILS
uniref:Secreted protein n=1 Tax=Heterorhabditis bacteriophora TaxID=37862 RepID=A0A1I7WQ14_HETBA